VHGLVNPHGWLGPAQPFEPGWTQPQKFFKNYFKKGCDFPQIFLLYFNQYWFVFLYYKNTNLVLKYSVFVKK